MDVFLAGTYSRPYLIESDSKIMILESFYYVSNWMDDFIKNHWNFLLDSGAFTFMGNVRKGDNIDWDEYLSNYIDYINKLDIKLFFELDIDLIVGIKEVERLRLRLEKETNKKSIPVWHKERGIDYWNKMVDEYDYVAIGGIVSNEIKRKEYPIFTNLLNIAFKSSCKVHGLGFTNMKGLSNYKFHSVDSTAWTYGNRGGFLYHFNGKKVIKIDKPKGTKLEAKAVAVHNFNEWIKFQNYAKNNL